MVLHRLIMKWLAAVPLRFALATAVLAVIPATAAAADLLPPSPRQGYYASLGISQMGQFLWQKGDADAPRFGSGFNLRLGEMLTQRLGLGVELAGIGGAVNGDEVSSITSLFTLEGQVVLWRTLAAHAGVGLGVLQLERKDAPDPDDRTKGAYGGSFLLGLSYDFFPYRKRLSGGLSLSPTVRARFISSTPLDTVAVFLGVDIAWWTGLPKNQLDLPPDRAF